jgi:hypothetical protein
LSFISLRTRPNMQIAITQKSAGVRFSRE